MLHSLAKQQDVRYCMPPLLYASPRANWSLNHARLHITNILLCNYVFRTEEGSRLLYFDVHTVVRFFQNRVEVVNLWNPWLSKQSKDNLHESKSNSHWQVHFLNSDHQTSDSGNVLGTGMLCMGVLQTLWFGFSVDRTHFRRRACAKYPSICICFPKSICTPSRTLWIDYTTLKVPPHLTLSFRFAVTHDPQIWHCCWNQLGRYLTVSSRIYLKLTAEKSCTKRICDKKKLEKIGVD